jgi:hypothetical protein
MATKKKGVKPKVKKRRDVRQQELRDLGRDVALLGRVRVHEDAGDGVEVDGPGLGGHRALP